MFEFAIAVANAELLLVCCLFHLLIIIIIVIIYYFFSTPFGYYNYFGVHSFCLIIDSFFETFLFKEWTKCEVFSTRAFFLEYY